MLGKEQKEEFFKWLAAVNQTVTFKFVVSSVPFMTLWGGPNGQVCEPDVSCLYSY